MQPSQIKAELLEKLKAEKCFWSYDVASIDSLPDDLLIENTLLHLDLEEINQLFSIFPFGKIKKVWLETLVPQGEYLYSLNRHGSFIYEPFMFLTC